MAGRQSLGEHAQRAARAYGAAADHYGHVSLSFWDRFSRAGVPHSDVVAESGQHRLDRPDSFWDVVLGSGYRATVDALSQEQHDGLRERLLGQLQSRGVTALRTDVVFGAAQRPG
jgi:hypothetical protein